jgi:hypothetical protein
MNACRSVAAVLTAAVFTCTSGCVSISSPAVQDDLKLVSAGYTGCLPQENTITNSAQQTGGLMWNATCKGRSYLCTQVGIGNAATNSCAPVAQ